MIRSLVKYALNNRAVTYFLSFLMIAGGILSFISLAQLEDPIFSIKSAVIITKYPGASPEEVELEVTDRIEKAIQEMPQLKKLVSYSSAGVSRIKVDIKDQYWSDKLPQIWDEMRKKIRDVSKEFPEGVESPSIGDDFNFVYGFLLGVTGDGYTYRELEQYAKDLKKELSLVKGVTRVGLWGVQNKVIYVEISEKQVAALGLTSETLLQTLKYQNEIVDSGSIDIGPIRFRVSQTGEFSSPEEIADLHIHPKAADIIGVVLKDDQSGQTKDEKLAQEVKDVGTEIIRLGDIATITEGYIDPPQTVMRYNGQPAIGIQLAGAEDENIVAVGQRIEKRLEELQAILPVGINVDKIAWQSDQVSEAVNGFVINLLEAIVIVLIVLIIPSGVRMGLIVGIDLVMTILATLIIIALMNIPLERMSLGALIIALGMMVDNAIVVSDKAAVLMRQGVDRVNAVTEAASSTAYPLLAATLVAVMAFYPIYGSEASAGEYCRTLFIVVAAALIISWLIALMVTPIQCLLMLPVVEKKEDGEKPVDEFSGPFFQKFRKLIAFLIKVRYLTVAVMLVLLAASAVGFGYVKQMFFPDSSRPQIMIDYWGEYGTRIQDTKQSVENIEKLLLEDPTVQSVSSFIGAGPPRFYLPVDPESNYPNYAQLIITFNSFADVDPFIEKYEQVAKERNAQAMIRFRKFGVGPSNTWPFQARISGPGEANLTELRNIGEEVKAIAQNSPYGRDWRLDMQNRTMKIVSEYDQKRARWAAVTRADIARATKRAYDGIAMGIYREGDDLIPIVVRHPEAEREVVVDNIFGLQVKPSGSVDTIPLGQVVTDIKTEWEDPFIVRLNRRRAVSVEGGPTRDSTFPTLYKDVIGKINALDMPPGYEIFWDAEFDSTQSAQTQLIPGLIPAGIIMVFLILTVFNSFKPLIIIVWTIPFAAIGITGGLLFFDTPFGFLALLGAMSLAGMMNKNIVVLLDTVNENLDDGMDPYNAVIEASVTRARPVLLAAGTTVLGVIPLLQDVFWYAMAVTIMAGLAVGSILSLVIVPVFYCILYRVPTPKKENE